MSSSTEKTFKEARIKSLEVEKDFLSLLLTDGRILKIPLAWFPRLVSAKVSERKKFRLIGRGIGIHWPDLDEDISLAGLLAGPDTRSNTETVTAR